MTPTEERALLDAAAAGLDDELRDAFAAVMAAIRAGTPPRDAVAAAMASFTGEMAETMAAALSAILGAAVGAEAALALTVGGLTLSSRLYLEGAATAEVVQGIVQRHVAGFADARALALELFEGYGFRPPGAEPLRMAADNPALPRYLREALLPDDKLRAGFEREFARIQVDGLRTGPLRAAYAELLDAIDGLEAGRGDAYLEERVRVAFFERMRYFATRIARTELHRTYMEREALLLLDDADVEFVQVRRAPGRGDPCICALITGRNAYGLGPGVYPKALAPRPGFHPFCMCVLSPRLDLTGRAPGRLDEGADAYFLRRLDGPVAARVMGSRARRDAVLAGAPALAVANAGRDAAYRITTVGGG